MGKDEKRYKHGKVECIDAIRSALTSDEFEGFCKGNVIKYVWRELYDGGDEDVCKAQNYLQWLHNSTFERDVTERDKFDGNAEEDDLDDSTAYTHGA